jgi:hypothetical protein
MKFMRTLAALGLILAFGASTAFAVDTTIYNIRTGDHVEGELVTVHNCVVTATGFWGFFMQVPEASHDPEYLYEYSGLWVFTGNSHLGQVQSGDLVDVTGVYDEYYGLTEIDISNPPCGTTYNCSFTVVGTAPVPAPVVVDISDVNLATSPLAEPYESVLIHVDDNDVTLYAGTINEYEEWYLRTDLTHQVGDSILVDHQAADPDGEFDYAQPKEDQLLTYVQGILDYDYDQFKIDPRSCPDDLGMGCVPELRAAWAYDNTHVEVLFAVDVEEISAESIYNYAFDSGLSVLLAQRDDSNHRLVRLTTAPQTPGIIDIIYVEAVFSEEGELEMEQASYTFTQGITPIHTLQYVEDLTVDASSYRDVVVTTTGRVTALDGRYFFLQEGDAGPFKHLYSRASAVGDIAVGDSVIVAGAITEYIDHETELSYQSGVQRFENLGPATHPVIVTDLQANQMIYDAMPNDGSAPDDNAPEPWEHARVRLAQPCYVDSAYGEALLFGEWWLLPGTGAPPDSCRTDFEHEMNDYGDAINFIPTLGDTLILSGILRYEYGLYRIITLTRDDIEQLHYGGSVDESQPGARRLWLAANRPNPFGTSTEIRFRLEDGASRVNVTVYDVTGTCVRHLLKGAALPAGQHVLAWDGSNELGLPCAAGTYFYRLEVDGRSEARAMIRLE